MEGAQIPFETGHFEGRAILGKDHHRVASPVDVGIAVSMLHGAQ